jgi:tryptophanase
MKQNVIFEPFKIKSVEPIRVTSEAERKQYLEDAHYNPFLLTSDQVLIDFLTDSGTSAMSTEQWAGLMRGDESYAGARSWQRFERVVEDLTSFPHILPTHQGRAAERILYGHLGGPGKVFISNTHFDTTRANVEFSGAEAIDCPTPEALEPANEHPFKGNMDTEQLKTTIEVRGPENVSAVIMTVTNNTGGGQPVSMANLKAVKELCRQYDLLFVLDACRMAENAYFIKHREEGFEDKTYRAIAQEMFALSDASTMSAKKDGLVNIGGFLAMHDAELAEACTNLLIITEGYTTYGGLSGRDMEAMAQGLEEVFDPDYLHYRIQSTAYLGNYLEDMGIPVVKPIGGHAVYVDAKALYSHIPVHEYPGHALACNLYIKGGIRCVEIGSVMFGKYDDNGELIPANMELVRLAIPRRVYTQSHVDYVIEVFREIYEEKDKANGFRITKEPRFLRHFTAHFEPSV